MIPGQAIRVVASYEGRARFARAETAAVRRPRLLLDVLDSATHVAEIPCGAGHFLADYAHAGVAVTLVDASPAMLTAAVEHAGETGLGTGRTFPIVSYLDDLPRLTGVDVVVVPNAALNLLACQTPLPDLLTYLRTSLGGGAKVLAQVACTHPTNRVDTATFYDSARQHGTWFTDRWVQSTSIKEAVVRRRCQHRDGNQLRIEFDYHDPNGTSLHTTVVELTLFSARQLIEAFHATGFTHIRFLPGNGTLSEILALTDGDRR